MQDESMGDEPQVEPQAEVNTEAEAQTEAQPQVAESSPASEDQHEQKSNGFQERINKVTAQKYAEKQRADEEARKRAELQAELESIKAQSQQSSISMPDEDLKYDDPELYAQKQAEYTRQVVAQELEAERKQREAIEAQASMESQQKAAYDRFVETATTDGVDLDEAFQSAQLLAQMGVEGSALDSALSVHPNQAAMMNYLAKNPHKFDELMKQNHPVLAHEALKSFESDALAKKITKSPDPIPDVASGGGMKENDEFGGFFKNASFD